MKKIQPMWSQGSWFLKIFSSKDLKEADVLMEFRRPILEKIQSIFGSVLVAEAEVATSKALIGPPEVRCRDHSGLSEDITDKNSEDPDDDMSSTESSHPPDPIANNKEEGLGPCVLAAEAEVATSKATSKDNVQQLGTEVARVTKIYIGAPEDDKSSGQYGLDKNSGDGLRSAKKSRRDVVDTEAVIMRKLFVRNLNSNVTEDKMRTYFSDFGEIENVQLPTYSDSGKIQGFAFVTFKESSSVDAVQTARPHRLAGTQLETTRRTPEEEFGNPEYKVRLG